MDCITRICPCCGRSEIVGTFFTGSRESVNCLACRNNDCTHDGSKCYRAVRDRKAALRSSIGSKKCDACLEVKAADKFYLSGDRLNRRCKECVNAKRYMPKDLTPPGMCSKCKTGPRASSSRWCRSCLAAYSKARRVSAKVWTCRNCKKPVPVEDLRARKTTVCPPCAAAIIARKQAYADGVAARRSERAQDKLVRTYVSRLQAMDSGMIRRACRVAVKVRSHISNAKATHFTCRGTKKNPGCEERKPATSFDRGPRRRTWLCRKCRNSRRDPEKFRAARRRNGRRAKRIRDKRNLQATPKWLTFDQRRAIRAVYDERDRLNALHSADTWNGRVITASGLHVPWNLRVITRKETGDKSSKFLAHLQPILHRAA